MSTLLRLSTPRLIKALERNGIKDGQISVYDLRKKLTQRGMSDRDMHSLFHMIIGPLEPPPCHMTHCKSFGGGGAPMNCSLERIPGKCTILKDFKVRTKGRAERAEKAKSEKTDGVAA